MGASRDRPLFLRRMDIIGSTCVSPRFAVWSLNLNPRQYSLKYPLVLIWKRSKRIWIYEQQVLFYVAMIWKRSNKTTSINIWRYEQQVWKCFWKSVTNNNSAKKLYRIHLSRTVLGRHMCRLCATPQAPILNVSLWNSSESIFALPCRLAVPPQIHEKLRASGGSSLRGDVRLIL